MTHCSYSGAFALKLLVPTCSKTHAKQENDNENNEQETQIWKVNINSKMPQITFVEDYVKQYNEVTATINISSSEDVSCQYSTYNDVLGNMNRTEETEHSQQLNITNFGNYTYYFNCNDSNNNFFASSIN